MGACRTAGEAAGLSLAGDRGLEEEEAGEDAAGQRCCL